MEKWYSAVMECTKVSFARYRILFTKNFCLSRVSCGAHGLSLFVESVVYSLVAVHRLLIAEASLIAEHKL